MKWKSVKTGKIYENQVKIALKCKVLSQETQIFLMLFFKIVIKEFPFKNFQYSIDKIFTLKKEKYKIKRI